MMKIHVKGLWHYSFLNIDKLLRMLFESTQTINIMPDLQFLNIHNLFTNERISVYLDKHGRMSSDTKDYFVIHISHLSKGVVIVPSGQCQMFKSSRRKLFFWGDIKQSLSFK